MNFHPTDVAPHPGPHAPRPGARQQAFTLIELLIVIAVLGLLMTLATLAWKEAKVRAYDTQALICARNIKTAEAIHLNDKQKYAPYEQLSGQDLSACSVVYRVALPPTPARTLLASLQQIGDALNSSFMASAQSASPTNQTPPPGPIGNGTDRAYAYTIRHPSGRTTFLVSETYLGPVGAAPADALALAGVSSSGSPVTAGGTSTTRQAGEFRLDIKAMTSLSPRLLAYAPSGETLIVQNSAGTTVGTYDYATNTASGGGYLPGGSYSMNYLGSPTGKINLGRHGSKNYDQIIHRSLGTFLTIGGTRQGRSFTYDNGWSNTTGPQPASVPFTLNADSTIEPVQSEALPSNQNFAATGNNSDPVRTDANLGSFRLVQFYDTATPFRSARPCVARCWEDGSWTITADATLTTNPPGNPITFPGVSGRVAYNRGDIRTALVDMQPRNAAQPIRLWAKTRTSSDVILSPVTWIGWPEGFDLNSSLSINLNLQADLGYMADYNWYNF